MSSPEPAVAAKPCPICGKPLATPTALFCLACNSFVDHELCGNCRYPIPPKARYCDRCKAGQGWRAWLNLPQLTLSLLTTLVAIGTLFFTQISNIVHRNSNTSVSFVSADPDYIYVDVTNTGKSKSLVRDAWLTFPTLEIKKVLLVLAANERTDMRKVVPAEGDMRLKYQVTGLARSSDAVTRQDILNRMNDAEVALDVVIQESDGTAPVRSDHFLGLQMAPLIESKLAR